MGEDTIIKNTIAFVKDTLKDAEGGHDWFHIERVYKNAILISETENANLFVVTLSALLHDIADSKFHNGDATIAPKVAADFLKNQNVKPETIKHVIKIIENSSFSSNIGKTVTFNSIELQVVQDADRLDAIGAIGIARTFNYGGFKNRIIYNPEIKPNIQLTKQEYKKSNGPTINPFYEKLLLLKDTRTTATGKRIAKQRHTFMVQFLEQFYAEWNGNR